MGNDTRVGLARSVCQAHFNFVDKISFNLHIQIRESGGERERKREGTGEKHTGLSHFAQPAATEADRNHNCDEDGRRRHRRLLLCALPLAVTAKRAPLALCVCVCVCCISTLQLQLQLWLELQLQQLLSRLWQEVAPISMQQQQQEQQQLRPLPLIQLSPIWL